MEYLESFTKLSKAIAGTLLGGFLLQLAIPVSKQYLALVPGRTLPFIYTVLTSHLLEDQFVSAIAFAVGVLFLLRILEPIYGSREVIRLLLYVLTATGATTFLLVFLAYLSTQTAKGGSLLYTEICGFHGGFAALLVAVKHVIPENEVALFGGLLRFRAKHLAALYVALVVAMAAVAGQALKLVPYAVFGAYYAWAYLRFWQHRGEGIRGDPADDFRFASFFPEPAQPLIDKLGAPLAALMPRPGGLAAAGAAAGGGSGSGGSGERGYRLGGAAGSGEESWDVARRRERGARALEERLGLKPGAAASLGSGGGSSQALAASAEAAAGDDIERGPSGA